MQIQHVNRREALLVATGLGIIFFCGAIYHYSTAQQLQTSVRPHHGAFHDAEGFVLHSSTHVIGRSPGGWRPPVVPDHLQHADQDNQELIQHIRDHWLIRPFPAGEWNLRNQTKVHYSQVGQSEIVDEALGRKTHGFFVECGAGDGQFLSNSLFFEKYRDWTGLLVEVDPDHFAKIVRRRRHAYMINACLSPVKHPVVLNYTVAKLMGGLDNYMAESHFKEISDRGFISGRRVVQCFPLASILAALGSPTVDYFSLDVEGPELDILRTLPLGELDIRALTVEFRVNGDNKATRKKLQALRHLLVHTHGYKERGIIRALDLFVERTPRSEVLSQNSGVEM